MDDKTILHHITELVDREHHLEREHGSRPLNEVELDELQHLEVELDQCWDLLRQRQAKREFGQDPNQAHVRSAGTVESYEQ
jgi:hypothetical protein